MADTPEDSEDKTLSAATEYRLREAARKANVPLPQDKSELLKIAKQIARNRRTADSAFKQATDDMHEANIEKARVAGAAFRANQPQKPSAAERMEPPFDLSRFEPSTLDLSHLHPAERNRILRREFYPQEVALLLDRKNPWTDSGKPEPLPPQPPKPIEIPEIPEDKSKPEKPKRTEVRVVPVSERSNAHHVQLVPINEAREGSEDIIREDGYTDKQVKEYFAKKYEPLAPPAPPTKRRKKLPERTTSRKLRLFAEALFGIGVGVGGTQIKSTALSLFLILIGWGLVTAAIWELNFLENKRQWQQRILNSLLMLLAGAVLFGIWWGARPEPGLTRKDVEEVIRNETALPNVETVMTIDKRFRLENRGSVALTDIELTQVDYLFQKRAWEEKRLQIELINKVGGPFAQIVRIDSGKASEEIDLKKTPFFKFRHFMDVSDREEAARQNYLIRITFRDERTKQKYITYRVTTSETNAPGIFEHLSKTGRSGPPERILQDDIPAAIINAQRQIDAGLGAKEVNIKYQWEN